MQDGDYHDIWIATAFGIVVFVLGNLLLGESEAASRIILLLVFIGGTLVRQHVADRERRKHERG